MAKENSLRRIRESVTSFFSQIAKGSETVFLVLFVLYLMTFLMRRIGWELRALDIVTNIRYGLLSLVVWGGAIYFFYLLAEWKQLWKNTVMQIVVGAAVLLVAAVFSRIMTIESFAAIPGFFFCFLMYKKDCLKVLKVILYVLVAVLLLAWLGTFWGITVDISKTGREYGGRSFGIIYPNTWGFIVLSTLMLFWYLYIHNKPAYSIILFWGAAMFMWSVVDCRTSAALCAVFPLLSILAEFIERRNAGKEKTFSHILLVCMPFIVFGITLILCWKMEWVKDTFYGTKLKTMAMRFVESGYSLRRNGISLFGHPFYDFDPDVVDSSIKITQIMDNAYISDLILRGVIWMTVCLSWLCFVHWKCLKGRNFRLLAISFIFLILATMERPALDVWFNYVFLYPLAVEAKNSKM